jgi:8-oxo-dGTP pyrophosphatase MutT (NUDIX family)
MVTHKTFHLGIKAIIKNLRGEVLLLKRQGREGWDLPGGRVQHGESPHETLKREVEEETGLQDIVDITPLKMVFPQGSVLNQFQINTASENTTATGLILWIHSCHLQKGQEVKLGHEHQDYLWASWIEACELLPKDYSAASAP